MPQQRMPQQIQHPSQPLLPPLQSWLQLLRFPHSLLSCPTVPRTPLAADRPSCAASNPMASHIPPALDRPSCAASNPTASHTPSGFEYPAHVGVVVLLWPLHERQLVPAH